MLDNRRQTGKKTTYYILCVLLTHFLYFPPITKLVYFLYHFTLFERRMMMGTRFSFSLFRYLLEHAANVSAVNNDGELAIDISESDEMEDLLQKEIDKQGINCDESRNTEERLMLEDARSWVNGKIFGDVPHNKTGATALHVAAAKGYIKVMGLLLQSGASVNSQVNRDYLLNRGDVSSVSLFWP